MDDLDRLDLERAQASRVPAFQDEVEAPPEPDQHEDRAREHHGGRKARPRGGEKIPGRAIASIRLDGAADAAGIPAGEVVSVEPLDLGIGLEHGHDGVVPHHDVAGALARDDAQGVYRRPPVSGRRADAIGDHARALVRRVGGQAANAEERRAVDDDGGGGGAGGIRSESRRRRRCEQREKEQDGDRHEGVLATVMSGPVARCAIRPKAHSGRPRLPLSSRQRQPCEPENAYLGRCRARGRAVGRKARWIADEVPDGRSQS